MSAPPADAPPSAKARRSPSQLALAIGAVVAVVTVASGIAAALEQWHDDSPVSRHVFGNVLRGRPIPGGVH